jgi:hypothetical protein
VRWQYSSYGTTADGTPGSGNPDAPVSAGDTVIPSREELTDRVWPRLIAGMLLAYRYDPSTGSFAMVATSGRVLGGRGDDTVVYVPSMVGGAVSVTGDATLVTVVRAPDGSRLAFVNPTGQGKCHAACRPSGSTGRYVVTVGSDGTSVADAIQPFAAHPMPPISETQARTLAEQALTNAEASSNPKIKSNAQLVGALSALLLGTSDPNS